MKKNQKSLFVIALLLLVGLTSGHVASTYAKYASEITGSKGTATVAKWAFTEDNTVAGTGEQAGERVGKALTIDLAQTYNPTTLVNGKIAPGTEGSFDIALSNENTETGVDFTIKVSNLTSSPSNEIPTNLKFYKTRTGSAGSYIYSNELTPGTTTITGQLVAGENNFPSIPIYWKWEFGSSDDVNNSANEADTTSGEVAPTLTIGVDITGVQTAPGTTAITSHIN